MASDLTPHAFNILRSVSASGGKSMQPPQPYRRAAKARRKSMEAGLAEIHGSGILR